MNIPEDLKRNLENYLSYLNDKINLEEDVLILDNGLKDDSDNSGNYVGTKEPITKVLLAYKGAREYLFFCFPELRR